MNPKEQYKQITIDRVVITSFLVDLSDVLVNTTIALITGSVTMLSQAFEGMSDLFSSTFLLWGNKRSKQPPDKRHPYGYGKETYFWALISGLIAFSVTSTAAIYLGYRRILEPEIIKNLPLALFALGFSFFSNGYSAIISYKRLMRKNVGKGFYKAYLNSPLIEVKTSLVLDFMGTVASILGLAALTIYSISGNLIFDGLGAILTGLALAASSFTLLVGVKGLIIGQSASLETLDRIKEAVLSSDKVLTIVDLRTLILGSNKLLINIEVNTQDDLTTNELEKLIDEIEKKIREKIRWNASIQIELESVNL